LKEDISSRNGLFGIQDPAADETEVKGDIIDNKHGSSKISSAQQIGLDSLRPPPESKNEGAIRVREKRWQVFVARAVFRFEEWWKVCVPNQFEGKWCHELSTKIMLEDVTSHWPRSARGMVEWMIPNRIPPLGKLAFLYKVRWMLME
jgi:hypothetical protein